MLPDPLHPAVVHFPIVLAFLLPIVALAALWRIRRGVAPRPAWSIAVATAAALSASAWLAVETGEADEERVEHTVGEAPLESHEEAAERFLALSGGVLLLAGAGLLRGRLGAVARLATSAGALGLLVAVTLVGHSGGQLVYRYRAAEAHVQIENGSGPPVEGNQSERKDSDD
ncbi:MAG TPA: DUF2231 domain-containing protein [Gemmatimonadales bacterium]|jgi:uncharacterized membrane protein